MSPFSPVSLDSLRLGFRFDRASSDRLKRDHPPPLVKADPESLENILPAQQGKPHTKFFEETHRRLEPRGADLERQFVLVNRDQTAIPDLGEDLASLF
jgi:hypothetical protein